MRIQREQRRFKCLYRRCLFELAIARDFVLSIILLYFRLRRLGWGFRLFLFGFFSLGFLAFRGYPDLDSYLSNCLMFAIDFVFDLLPLLSRFLFFFTLLLNCLLSLKGTQFLPNLPIFSFQELHRSLRLQSQPFWQLVF